MRDAPLVFKQEGLNTEDPASHWVQAIYPEARRVTGQWPSPEKQAEVLLQALRELAEDAPDVETQGKAKKVLKAVGEGGQKFIVELLSSAAAKMVTGG